MKWFYFWQTQTWHIVVLGHSVGEFDPSHSFADMFSHECSCGVWWFK